MIRKKKLSPLSIVIFWNLYLVLFELIVLGVIESYFFARTMDTFTSTTLEQHLESRQKSLERMLTSMSEVVADDISSGLLETGYFDRIKIVNDFGQVLVDVKEDMPETFYSNLAQDFFGIEIIQEKSRPIHTRFNSVGQIDLRVNLSRFVDSLMRESFIRGLLFVAISLLLSLGGTSYFLYKIHRGARSVGQLATDLAAHNEEGLKRPHNYHFSEFEFLSEHLSHSFQNLVDANTRLSKAIEDRKATDETYRLTLQALKLYSKMIDTDGRILFSNFEGMKNPAFRKVFRAYHPELISYLNNLKKLGYETKLLAQERERAQIISENLKIQIVEGENSWFVQLSKLKDARILLTCSNVSEVRQNDSRRFHREKIEALGRISSNVAHEFNNMLNIMINSIETIRQEQSLDTTATMHLDTAMIAGQRAHGVVTRLQQLSRDQELNCEYLDLQKWLEDSVPLIRAVIGPQTGITIECDTPVPVLADYSALDAVVINLCKNAADAMRKPGHITISVSPYVFSPERTPDLDPQKEYVTLSFRDTGPGVPEDFQSKIFEPYFSTKANHMGTGLGLPEVRNMIAKMHGEIQYNTENREGAEFMIYLEKGTAQNIIRHPKTGPQETEPAKALSILVVEDEMLLARLWENFLIPMGINVVTALTLHQARQYLEDKEKSFDFAILDNTLPDGFGAELLEEIRARHPQCKCINVSGEQEIQNAVLYDAHLKKPIRLNTLRDVIFSKDRMAEQA